MSIKMPLKFHGSYKVAIRKDGVEKQEICQKLSMTPLAGGDHEQSPGSADPSKYLITYFCFGCRRVLEGAIKENREDGTVFKVDDREIEFSPASRPEPGKTC